MPRARFRSPLPPAKQLNDYVVELSGSFLPEHLQAFLSVFVEMAQNTKAKAKAGGGGGGGGGAAAEDARAEAPAASSQAPEAAAPAGDGKKQTWDESFMNMDPLAGLLKPDPTPPPAPAPAADKPKLKPAASPAAVPAVPAAPLPAFKSFTSAKSYAANGEGLRDAIKDKNVAGVKQVLAAAPKGACNYQDRLSQTMLHLAAIFDHTEIANLLLDAGADPTVKNSDGESAIDVAQPTLKRKMEAALAARAGGV